MFYYPLVEWRYSNNSVRNDTKLNENEVTLRVDLVSSICCKGQVSQ